MVRELSGRRDASSSFSRRAAQKRLPPAQETPQRAGNPRLQRGPSTAGLRRPQRPGPTARCRLGEQPQAVYRTPAARGSVPAVRGAAPGPGRGAPRRAAPAALCSGLEPGRPTALRTAPARSAEPTGNRRGAARAAAGPGPGHTERGQSTAGARPRHVPAAPGTKRPEPSAEPRTDLGVSVAQRHGDGGGEPRGERAAPSRAKANRARLRRGEEPPPAPRAGQHRPGFQLRLFLPGRGVGQRCCRPGAVSHPRGYPIPGGSRAGPRAPLGCSRLTAGLGQRGCEVPSNPTAPRFCCGSWYNAWFY